VALLDPNLVARLPNELVAATGLDALAHAIESAISVFATLFTDAVGLEAVYQVSHHLLDAMKPESNKSRANLLYASTMAGQAFSYARTGLAHGMAHPVGSYYHIHHGLVVAILLPYVLEFNKAYCEEKLSRVAAAMGERADPQAAIDKVIQLKKACSIPDKLGEVGVTVEHLDKMTQDAHQSGNAQLVNPRKPTLEEVRAIYLQAI
jgi:alcohol dehydrogenase class IV